MKRVLIVEDSPTIARVLKNRMENELNYRVEMANSYGEAMVLLDLHGRDFAVALLDLSLPDADTGAIVDPVIALNIPVIVFTGVYDERIQEEMWARHVVDYVVKEGCDAVDRIVETVRKLELNPKTKILVVDDSAVILKHIVGLLRQHRYDVLRARNGCEALTLLNANPDTALVITDYNMPEMDGFSLIRRIRAQKSAHELPIIGMSGHFNKNLSAHFMKCGANDYMGKPFSPDEFYCRITQNLEMAKYIREIRDAAFHDFLTGLQNRHYFWKFAPQMCDNARKDGAFLALALIDVDFFKHVNDTYNHEAGDAVLKWIGNTMTAYFGPETIFARFGGEEFCVLFPTPDEEYAFSIMDRFRETVAAQIIHYQQLSLSITVSIGICVSKEYSPERMIECADNAMYQAKNSGRNRCVTHHQEDS